MKRLLAVFLLMLLVSMAGCIEPETSVRSSQLDNDSEIANEFSVSVERIEPDVRGVITNQETRNTSVRFSSFSEVIRYNDTYYEFDRDRVGTAEVKRVEITNVETLDGEATYSMEQLSQADKKLIEAFLPQADEIEQFGAGEVYRRDEITNSVLVGKTDVNVSYQNTTYRLDVESRQTNTRRLFRYDSTVVSNDTGEYASKIRGQHLHTISSIDKTNSVLNQSLSTGSYYGEKSDDFEALNRSLPQEKALILSEYKGRWLVQYDGQIYKLSVDW